MLLIIRRGVSNCDSVYVIVSYVCLYCFFLLNCKLRKHTMANMVVANTNTFLRALIPMSF